ncbi:hypothetical protein Thermo_01987 [Thermoplasmatales archaeon]|nr:hypothetical protein Thermo_01987 [Thermoplasmatales archaeon]
MSRHLEKTHRIGKRANCVTSSYKRTLKYDRATVNTKYLYGQSGRILDEEIKEGYHILGQEGKNHP